jgi:hypothetical protein
MEIYLYESLRFDCVALTTSRCSCGSANGVGEFPILLWFLILSIFFAS